MGRGFCARPTVSSSGWPLQAQPGSSWASGPCSCLLLIWQSKSGSEISALCLPCRPRATLSQRPSHSGPSAHGPHRLRLSHRCCELSCLATPSLLPRAVLWPGRVWSWSSGAFYCRCPGKKRVRGVVSQQPLLSLKRLRVGGGKRGPPSLGSHSSRATPEPGSRVKAGRRGWVPVGLCVPSLCGWLWVWFPLGLPALSPTQPTGF